MSPWQFFILRFKRNKIKNSEKLRKLRIKESKVSKSINIYLGATNLIFVNKGQLHSIIFQ